MPKMFIKMIDQKIGWLNTTNSSKASPLRSFHHVEQRACDDRSPRRCGESSQCGGAILVGWMMDMQSQTVTIQELQYSITCAHSMNKVSTCLNQWPHQQWLRFWIVGFILRCVEGFLHLTGGVLVWVECTNRWFDRKCLHTMNIYESNI